MVDSRQANIDQPSLFDMSRLAAAHLIWQEDTWLMATGRKRTHQEAVGQQSRRADHVDDDKGGKTLSGFRAALFEVE
jgi:hypothetical protein